MKAFHHFFCEGKKIFMTNFHRQIWGKFPTFKKYIMQIKKVQNDEGKNEILLRKEKKLSKWKKKFLEKRKRRKKNSTKKSKSMKILHCVCVCVGTTMFALT